LPRRLTFLFALLFLFSPAFSPAGTLDDIHRRGEIVIGTDATYPPFEWKVGDRYKGFDIDVGDALAKRLGVRARWVNTAFDGIFPALLSGKFDMVISITTITPERRKTMAFSAPYYVAGNMLAVRKADERKFTDLKSLRGHIVGAQLNTTGQFAVEKFGGIEVRKYNSIDLSLLDLENKRIDAVSADAPVLWWAIKTNYKNLATVGGFITHENYGMPMRKSDPDLIAAVNAALKSMRADGTYDRIYAQWFGKGEAPQRSAVEKSMAPASGGIARSGALRDMAPALLLGAVWTLELTLAGLAGGLILGLLLALMRLGPAPPLRSLAMGYVEIVRGTPLLVQVFFIYFVLPEAGLSLPQAGAGMLALALNSAAYVSEIFRAGIESVEAGQREAALALGLTERQGMRWIVLPQAFRRVIPPLTNEGIALLKDSSLVSVMGLAELTRTGQELASRFANPLTVWPAVALLYLVLTLPLTYLSRSLERRMATP
jgi:His/Glu/Gln/Arg/opine family amino acid ABC transporter permease subunit